MDTIEIENSDRRLETNQKGGFMREHPFDDDLNIAKNTKCCK